MQTLGVSGRRRWPCARFGVPAGSNLTSRLEWLGSTVRFQHFRTEALQKRINERPLFLGTESNLQNGGHEATK